MLPKLQILIVKTVNFNVVPLEATSVFKLTKPAKHVQDMVLAKVKSPVLIKTPGEAKIKLFWTLLIYVGLRIGPWATVELSISTVARTLILMLYMMKLLNNYISPVVGFLNLTVHPDLVVMMLFEMIYMVIIVKKKSDSIRYLIPT